jgi:bacterioferritin-associated ferredoxin
MYICLCQPVTDGQIREAVCSGIACNVRQLQTHLGIAKQCKKCARAAKEVVNETLLSLEQPNHHSIRPIHFQAQVCPNQNLLNL